MAIYNKRARNVTYRSVTSKEYVRFKYKLPSMEAEQSLNWNTVMFFSFSVLL